MKIKVSIGEIVDKHTILDIKRKKIKNPIKLKHILAEREYLQKVMKKIKYNIRSTDYNKLYKINASMWVIEEKIREKGSKEQFDEEFSRLSRKLYLLNDERARIKKNINLKYKSEIVEEKSYENV